MIRVKVADLSGAALDWAVAKGTDRRPMRETGDNAYPWCCLSSPESRANVLVGSPQGFSPSTNWSQGGPLIDEYDPEERRLPERDRYAEVWLDRSGGDVTVGRGRGPNRLIAFCRALVDAKLGAEIEIPEELLNQE